MPQRLVTWWIRCLGLLGHCFCLSLAACLDACQAINQSSAESHSPLCGVGCNSGSSEPHSGCQILWTFTESHAGTYYSPRSQAEGGATSGDEDITY